MPLGYIVPSGYLMPSRNFMPLGYGMQDLSIQHKFHPQEACPVVDHAEIVQLPPRYYELLVRHTASGIYLP